MWAVGSDRVAYVNKKNGKWEEVARFEALEDTFRRGLYRLLRAKVSKSSGNRPL